MAAPEIEYAEREVEHFSMFFEVNDLSDPETRASLLRIIRMTIIDAYREGRGDYKWPSKGDVHGMDYSKKENWTVEMLEEALVLYTVLQSDERGNFDRLWKAKLDCEKVRGAVIRPA